MYDDTQLRLGISCIAAAFAKTMQKRDPDFGLDFTKQLETIYRELRDQTEGNHGALEMVKWTSDAMERLEP